MAFVSIDNFRSYVPGIARSTLFEVVVSFPKTGIKAAIPSVSVPYVLPPYGDKTVPLPIDESNISTKPF